MAVFVWSKLKQSKAMERMDVITVKNVEGATVSQKRTNTLNLHHATHKTYSTPLVLKMLQTLYKDVR